ncbi:MAG: hypothetical protein ACD_7C00125G0006 [uncultured bacterium]|nr:MAG: hypothetical protein ACD_7C00125G0006 [uncultured bacterium]KKP68138.1 MAG: hypothetical protein UR66_C0008G0046 [Candidatus Moranbacteria bacterium GW2011_GWE1_35_17]KKP72225.1 MAG: hypothetical protein UR65_C0019G0008 [Candidatus Moranbacteria bacterium GW2011_GWE2_35_164]KKP83895.1 MAG: hypothetical protein UR83_C0031G0008 [Candidatus Moranbacteria bacterium GW2011_GWF2_35_54]
MNDDKCNHEKESGDLCAVCGATIRERCPECGEMELVTRKVCQTKLSEAISNRIQSAEKARENFQSRVQKYIEYSIFIIWLSSIIIGYPVAFFMSSLPITISGILICLPFFLPFFLVFIVTPIILIFWTIIYLALCSLGICSLNQWKEKGAMVVILKS